MKSKQKYMNLIKKNFRMHIRAFQSIAIFNLLEKTRAHRIMKKKDDFFIQSIKHRTRANYFHYAPIEAKLRNIDNEISNEIFSFGY